MAAKIGVVFYCLATLAVMILTTIGTLKYPSFNDPNADLTDKTEQLLVVSVFGAAIFGALALLVTAIATCMFMYRSNGNALAMGATKMQFTPGWSVGVWFIPILNLFRPYQAMKEIQMASSNPSGSQWKNAKPFASLAPWWTCWILGSIVSRFINRAELKGMDLGMAGVVGNWVAGLLLIIGGVLLIGIMQKIAIP